MDYVEQLLKEIKEIQEITKDYNKLKHLFSDDEGVATLAKLNQKLNSLQTVARMTAIKEVGHPKNEALERSHTSGLVRVRPCAEKYGDKTYLGFYLGDIAE